MKRFRIDFSIREVDVPAEEARGVKFGEEVSLDQVYYLFNRWRDEINALFQPPPQPDVQVAVSVNNVTSQQTMKQIKKYLTSQAQGAQAPKPKAGDILDERIWKLSKSLEDL